MKFAAIYSIVIGVGMLVQWLMSYLTKQIPELVTEPIRIAFHIGGEVATAALLIVAGVGLLRGAKWGKPAYYLASGMLLYTAIVSPGYFAQMGNLAWVGIFAVIILLVLAGLNAVGRE
jgi:hypothetical protein